MVCKGVPRTEFRDRVCASGECEKCGLAREVVVVVPVDDSSLGGVTLQENSNWVRAMNPEGRVAAAGLAEEKDMFLAKVNNMWVRNAADATASSERSVIITKTRSGRPIQYL